METEKNNAVEILAQTYTEAQLRAAYEAVKTKNEETRFQRFKQECKPLTCTCGKRAQYLARPDRIVYDFSAVQWNDEIMRVDLGYTSIGNDYNGEQPGDDDGESPSTDDFVAFAWCGEESCDWFSIGSSYSSYSLFDRINRS
jgi:hypothetical protein